MEEEKSMWMVRAGEGAYLFDEFKEKNVVAIGWNDVGDLSNVEEDLNEIKERLKKQYPDDSKGKVNISAGQIYRFRYRFDKNDYVITYNPEERIYLVGAIISDYEYNPALLEFHHIRKVKWLGKVSRDDTSTSTKYSLGAISTLFEVKDEAMQEILNLLSGKTAEVKEPEKEIAESDFVKEEMIGRSHEFIKDKILSLDWEQMQELVAGILRAMGYKTSVSERGPDRGRDITASPDGLGLEEPRIVVEVKHRKNTQMDTKEVSSFGGRLRSHTKGIYVSTGGFSKDAKLEAERSNIPITLIDSDKLVQLIVQYYDKFDSDTRSLLTLKKLYWPI